MKHLDTEFLFHGQLLSIKKFSAAFLLQAFLYFGNGIQATKMKYRGDRIRESTFLRHLLAAALGLAMQLRCLLHLQTTEQYAWRAIAQ